MNPIKVFVGIAIIFLGLSLLALSQPNVQFGGVILIGPIPIVLSSSPSMAFFAIILAIAMLLFLLALRW